MTAKQIQHALYAQFGQQSQMMIPNYTPRHWFEADMIRITKSGFMDEFEIKVSVSDFKADALKGSSEYELRRWQHLTPEQLASRGLDTRTKHERLAAGDTRGPCRFWFAVPEELLTKLEIPEWAGVVTFRPWGKIARMNGPHGAGRFKQAPKRHRERAEASILEHARSVFYYRYWNIRQGQEEVKA